MCGRHALGLLKNHMLVISFSTLSFLMSWWDISVKGFLGWKILPVLLPWRLKWGTWPARGCALSSRHREGDFCSERSHSWNWAGNWTQIPHSEGMKWGNPVFWRVLMGCSADGSCSGINYGSWNGGNGWILKQKMINLVLSPDSGAAFILSQLREAQCGMVPALLSLGGSI